MISLIVLATIISSDIPVVKMFNLDIASPDIRIGPANSLFGFSVVSSLTKPQWIYVGAPRAILPRTHFSINSSNSTETISTGRLFGNIFECPNGTNECRSILTENDLFKAMPSFNNVLDDAWLGSSLIATLDDSLVTCAYHLMRNISSERYDTRGACYRISSDYNEIFYYDFCDLSSETELLHEGSALCQTGISLAYMPFNERSDIILFGEPGAFQWSGRIEAEHSHTLLRQLYTFKSALSIPSPYSYLGYSVLIIKSKNPDVNDPPYIFIASAPRASNGRGEIRFYTKRFVSLNNIGYDTLQPIYQINNTNNRSTPMILIGEQTGSYFGYAMTAGDLNGDGHTDLVVSAPYYYSKKPSYGGAVYIYYGLNEKFSDDRRQILLESPIHSRFGFAVICIADLNKDGIDDLAVSAPGEKHNIHTGSVYIYLGSRDSQLTKYAQKIVPSQLVNNLLQTTIINDFGYSLATQSTFNYPKSSSFSTYSNATINNNYPSLIIGVPKANMIVNLRSHPLVNVKVQIKNMNNLQAIKFDSENRKCRATDGSLSVCFDVELCFDSEDTLAKNLIITYTLTADYLSTIGRILLYVSNLPTITNKQALNTCEIQTFIVKSVNGDFLTPIDFLISYNISQDRNDLRGKAFIFEESIPMINSTDDRKIQFQANFYKGCGNDDRCMTDLKLTAEFLNAHKISNLSVLGMDSEIRIRLNLSNFLLATHNRRADPAYGTKIDIYFQTSFVKYSHALASETAYSCLFINSNHIRCKMSDFFNNPFPPEEYSILDIIFTLSNVSLSNILTFNFNSTTLTNEINLDNNNVTLKAKVLLKTNLSLRSKHEPEQVIVSGDQNIGLSSIKNIDQFGMEVTHIYTVINSGPNNVRSHNVTIYWPYETLDDEWEDGKVLLYLVEEPIVEISSTSSASAKVNGYCERSPAWRDHMRILDSLNRTTTTTTTTTMNKRKRRQEQTVDNTIDSKTLTVTVAPSINPSTIIRSVTLTCDPNYQNVRCYTINCHIDGLGAQNYYSIKIRARLWNSTLIENYFDTYDRVDIQSFALLQINDPLIFQTSNENDNATATTPAEFANRSDKITVPRLPLWVPLVGAMAGLILLIFIVIVCCLLGFFQRTKAPSLKKKTPTFTLDGTTTNSSSDEQQRILHRQFYRQQMVNSSSTTNSLNDDNFYAQQTTLPIIHSIPEVPSADSHDQDIDEEEEDDELINNNLANQSDIEEEVRFPVEDDDDDYSTKMNEPLVDVESMQSVK